MAVMAAVEVVAVSDGSGGMAVAAVVAVRWFWDDTWMIFE